MSERNKRNKELLYEYLVHNNQNAYDELYFNNLNLVHKYITKYIEVYNKTKKELNEEYALIGYIALHNAINSFDINKIDEISFSTYATTCIKNAILSEIYKENMRKKRIVFYEEEVDSKFNVEKVTYKDVLIDSYDAIKEYEDQNYKEYKKRKIKESLNELDKQTREIIEFYYGFDGIKMTKEELMNKYNLSYSNFRNILSKAYKFLKEQLCEFKYTCNDIDKEQKIKKSKINQLYKRYGKEKILETINKLDENTKKIINLYYGLDGEKPKTAREISESMNIDFNFVNNVVHKSLKKIINFINGNVEECSLSYIKKGNKIR